VEDTVATNETRTAAASFFSKFLHVCLHILTHFFRDGHEEMALYSYQEVYSDAQEKVLRVHHRVINLSEMGTGKSYTTCFLGKKFDNRMLIVSDLSVRPSWVKIASSFKVDVLDTLSFKKLTCSNLHVEAVGDSFECTKEFCELAKDTRGIMLVVDEFQALKNDSLQNRAVSALTHCLLASSPSNNIVFLSRTPIDKEEQITNVLRALGYISSSCNNIFRELTCDLHPDVLTFLQHCRENQPRVYEDIFSHWISSRRVNRHTARMLSTPGVAKVPMRRKDKTKFITLLYYCFLGIVKPAIAPTAMSIADMQLAVKKTCINLYGGMQPDEYAAYSNAVRELAEGSTINAKSIAPKLRNVERSKIGLFSRLAVSFLKTVKHCKIIVYLHYLENIQALKDNLSSYSPLILIGRCCEMERADAIEKFQAPSNEYSVLISNPKVGGSGVSLHDLAKDGVKRPRITLYSLDFDATVAYQASGRAYRKDAQSSSTFIFVFGKVIGSAVPDCAEQRILRALAKKSIVHANTVHGETHNFLTKLPSFIWN